MALIRDRIVRWLAPAMRAAELPTPQPGKGTFLIQLGLNNLDVHPIKDKRDQLDSYVGWVYGCVSRISQDLRTNPRALWRKAGRRREDWIQLPDEQLPQLFRKANLRQTWGQLIETRNQHKDLTGEAWWHLIGARPGGRIQGIEMIQPDWIEDPIWNTERTQVVAWWIAVPGHPRKEIDVRDLVLDFYPDPRDPLRGASPVEAFALSHHLDIYLRAYGMKLIRDGAMVAQYVKSDQDLDQAQADVIESRLSRKFRTPGRIAVLGKGATMETVSLPLRDLDLLRMLKPTMDQVLGIYGVPRSKFGLTEGAGNTNQKVADKAYQENSLLPRLLTFDEIVNEVVLPRVFDDAAGIVYESESPVEVDREFLLKKAEMKFKTGATTVNQFFQELGDDPVPDGDVRLVPTKVVIVRSFDESAEPEPEPQPEPPEEVQGEAAARLAEAFRRATERRADQDEIRRLRRIAAEARFLRVQEDLERALRAKVRQVFSREQRLVREAAEQNIRSVGTDRRDWIDQVLGGTRDDWEETIREAVFKAMRAGAGLLQEEVVGALSFSVFEERAKRYAARLAGEKVGGIQGETMEQIRRVIAAGIERGDSVERIARALVELYDGFKGTRSETIARTETATSINWGKYEAARETERRLGMKIERTWIAVNDERTREAHAAADGQRIGLQEHYTVAGVAMKHPGDPAAPPELVINCRCNETFEDVSTEE